MSPRWLALLLLLGCNRLNPEYCDSDIPCAADERCNDLHRCESLAADLRAAPGDLRGPAADLVSVPDLANDLRTSADPPCSGNNCTCRPSNMAGCTCNEDDGCTLTCGDSCYKDLSCTKSSCTAACGAACKVTCREGRCTITVGAGSTVVCDKADCTVTCQGTCKVTFDNANATARVTCAGGQPQMTCPMGSACGPC